MATVTNFSVPGVYVYRDADDSLVAFDASRRFFSWIYWILVNECLKARRDHPRREPLAPDRAAAGTPADRLESAERRRAVQAAILALPMDGARASRGHAARSGGRAVTDHESDRRVSQFLEELGSAEPPPDFSRNIIWGIRKHRTSLSHRKGIDMTRKAMWGLAAAASILLAIFVVRGFPLVDQGTESTIGAAQRYQAPQIEAKNVMVGDTSAQAVMQSETWDRIVKD